MKAFTVDGEKVSDSISVCLAPYPHVVLGDGGNKRATWVAIGKRDADTVVKKVMAPCSWRGKIHELIEGECCTCEKCGTKFVPTDKKIPYRGDDIPAQIHPDFGEMVVNIGIVEVGIIALKDASGQYSGKHLIVAPRDGKDERVLVRWSVASGYRGGASIYAGDGVAVIAVDSSWHSGRGNLGETAEILAVLKPGQELTASRSGRRVQETRARLSYDGTKISVIFGDDNLFSATSSEEVEGDYV